MLFRSRFADLVRRQLDLFAAEHAGDLAEVRERLDAYHGADREEAEERYGDYVDAVDAVLEALDDVRDRYAATLDAAAEDEYVRAFERAARRRRELPARQ